MLNFQQTEIKMKKCLNVLKTCPLFAGIEEEELTAMFGCFGAKPQKFEKGEAILSEGDPVRWIGVVLSGTVQIVQVDYYGNRSMMAKLGPADIFAEAFACAGVKEMPVDAVAAETTEVLLIDAGRMLQPCSAQCSFHQRLIRNLLKVVASKNLALRQKIEITSQRSTREKLMAYLLLQAKRAGKDSFSIAYDRQELADFLEVDRSGLSAEISKLRKEGKLICRKNHFQLLS